ncbi:MAG: galactose-1-phosphate uridylyltransferase [Candidatus Margulisiibacteriota bacterium]|jgi:UDPglucose--hexose-1-phosphate uridylyltransferase
MAEIRKDPITGRWVIIAVDRSQRPSDFVHNQSVQNDGSCPFCVGAEDKTPPEIVALRPQDTQANKPGWKVRVVPNKFPALKIEGELEKHGVGLYDVMHGVGAHEVIVETPDHSLGMADLEVSNIADILEMYKNRLLDLSKDPRFKYILIFKNHGYEAGATLAHTHSQVIATPVTPINIKSELHGAREYFLMKDRCLFCDIIRQELMFGKDRVAIENELFIVLAPFASRFPFEFCILPKKHAHNYTSISEEEKWALADILKALLTRMKDVLNDPSYNFILHTSPRAEGPARPGYWQTLPYDFHWHIEIIPRLTRTAGFEWGTGFYINPTAPEEAAKYIRQWEIKKKEMNYMA